MRTNKTIGFADLAAARRIKKEDFLTHINKIIDWRPVGNIINKNYQKGKAIQDALHTMVCCCSKFVYFKIGIT